jgi:hypothetical protein
VVTGLVRDTTGRPIEGAEVVAVGGRRTALTSARGAFVLAGLEPGPELFVIRSIGFRLQRFPTSILPGDTVRLTVVLGPRSAQILPEIVVEAYGKRFPARLADFAKRMYSAAVPRSRFIDPETFDELARFDLGHVLRRGGLAVGGTVATCPRMGRITGAEPGLVVYVDGIRWSHGGAFDVRSMPVTWLQAAEVYVGPAEIPIEYSATGTGCVVLLWTK